MAVPSGITRLRSLEYLDLRQNMISVLPDDLDKLQELHTFDVSINRLEVFPLAITKLRNLSVFRCFANPLRQLPTYPLHAVPLLSKLCINILLQMKTQVIADAQMAFPPPRSCEGTEIGRLFGALPRTCRHALDIVEKCDWCRQRYVHRPEPYCEFARIGEVSAVPVIWYTCSAKCWRTVNELKKGI